MQCSCVHWDIMGVGDLSLLCILFFMQVSDIWYSYNFRGGGNSGLSKPLKEEPVIDYFDVQDWNNWYRIMV